MSFSLDNIILNESLDTSRLSSIDTSFNESYFIETLNYIREANNEYRLSKQVLYKSILESNNDNQIITESFNDFISKAIAIIKRFIEFIKSIFNKFITALNGAIKSDKYLIKNKKSFDSFDDNKHGFNMECFTFTFDAMVPLLNAEFSFDKEFADMYQVNTKDPETLIDGITKIQNSFVEKLQNGWYDQFRQKVISADYPISSGDFANELFAVYRNGQSTTTTESIKDLDIKLAYNRFASHDNFTKMIKKDKDNVTKQYTSIKDKISLLSNKSNSLDYSELVKKFIKSDYDGDNIPITPELLAKIELFIKAKSDQVVEMSNIHALAFTAKLDAIKSCYIQDKTLLYKALYRINGSISSKEGK